jgi:Golgi apyrase
MMAKGNWKYGVILDAGSSGTRVHIYRWLKNSVAINQGTTFQTHVLPELETHDRWTKKTHPGVSTFGETPKSIGPDHLAPLLEHALKEIPNYAVAETPLFLFGTAGMRLLPENQRRNLLNEICKYVQTKTAFSVPDCDQYIQVIPGETEGLYGWVAANYLLGGFDSPADHAHGKGHHTYGFLDMGGASAQIAFAPNSTEAEKHANDLKLLRLRRIDGSADEYRVFVTTWLGFGANEARRRYVEALVKALGNDKVAELPDPCLPVGLKMTSKGKVLPIDNSAPYEAPYLIGTGKFDECMKRTCPLLDKDAPCLDEPCLMNGTHVPAIDFDVNHFIGISEYWHTTHEVFEMAYKDKAYDFKTYQGRVKEFCEQDWTTIEAGVADETWGKKVDEQTAYEICFKASWLINVLHEGIGVPRVGIETVSGSASNETQDLLEAGKTKGFLDPFQAVNKIKSTEVSWTLGKMVLYASADVPSIEGALPVGFGSNEPGIPADFQYPGVVIAASSGNFEDHDSSLADKVHDTLFHSDPKRRIPGFLLFFVIIAIAVFYLMGREKRSRIMTKIFGGQNGRPTSLFGYNLPFVKKARHYERVLEEGNDEYEPADFELSDLEEDEFRPKTAGWDSPRRKAAPESMTPYAIDRRGLAVRTESRERLDLVSGRSRAGSPTRPRGM